MLFLYLDESGDYSFNRNGSEYLIYNSLATTNPYLIHYKLCELEKQLIKNQISLESGYFHATEDKQIVRNKVYEVLNKLDNFDIDTVVVEKCKANPSFREIERIYKKIYTILLKYVFRRHEDKSKILIFLHNFPIKKKRHAIEKGIKETISDILDRKQIGREIKYHITYLNSVYSYGLQATDYCCWALKKKWGNWGTKMDLRPYEKIKHNLKSEMELFAIGDGTKYY